MRRITVVVSAVAVVLYMAAGAYAQARPDFSGTWTMDPASAPAPPGGGVGGGRGGGRGGGGGVGFGPEFTAKQDANALTITRMQGGQTITAAYRLDGSESKNSVPGRQGGPPTEQVSKASWDGNRLVIVTTLDFGGNRVEQRRVLSLEGGNLAIEQTNPGFQGGAPTTVKVVYKKS
jgi:hypothetical protein